MMSESTLSKILRLVAASALTWATVTQVGGQITEDQCFSRIPSSMRPFKVPNFRGCDPADLGQEFPFQVDSVAIGGASFRRDLDRVLFIKNTPIRICNFGRLDTYGFRGTGDFPKLNHSLYGYTKVWKVTVPTQFCVLNSTACNPDLDDTYPPCRSFKSVINPADDDDNQIPSSSTLDDGNRFTNFCSCITFKSHNTDANIVSMKFSWKLVEDLEEPLDVSGCVTPDDIQGLKLVGKNPLSCIEFPAAVAGRRSLLLKIPVLDALLPQ